MELTLQEAKEKYTSFVIKLLKLVPEANSIWVDFQGSGDSFDCFNNVEIRDIHGNQLDTPEGIDDEIRSELSFIWWKVIENKLGCGFDGDGSRGEITINVKTGKVDAESQYYEMTQ